jgi:hypothetical protein
MSKHLNGFICVTSSITFCSMIATFLAFVYTSWSVRHANEEDPPDHYTMFGIVVASFVSILSFILSLCLYVAHSKKEGNSTNKEEIDPAQEESMEMRYFKSWEIQIIALWVSGTAWLSLAYVLVISHL